jgi:hypothetical protein
MVAAPEKQIEDVVNHDAWTAFAIGCRPRAEISGIGQWIKR